MRIAVFSDVHGNAAALAAVLSDMANDSFDQIVCGGDYALFGPRPAEAVDMVRAIPNAITILGNTDGYLQTRDTEILRWTRERLGKERLAWLGSRPFAYRVEGLTVVHASPTDVERVLAMEGDPFGHYRQSTPDEARELLGDEQADLIVHGHIHYPAAGEVDGRRVASVGSVGFPFDGDQRAAYAVLDNKSGSWQIEHRRVAYDHESVIQDIHDKEMPLAEEIARRIEAARALPLPSPLAADMVALKHVIGTIVRLPRSAWKQTPSGKLDVYAMAGDVYEIAELAPLLRSTRYGFGPSAEEIGTGDYSRYAYARFVGEVPLRRTAPLLWDRVTDSDGMRLVGDSGGTVGRVTEAALFDGLHTHGQDVC